MLKKAGNIFIILVFIALGGIMGNCVKAEETLISSKVGITGFQIRMSNNTDELNIAFRVVGNAPNKGSIITLNGVDYKVKEYGNIYTLDPNTTGYESKDKLNNTYTLLDPTDYSLLNMGFRYRGIKKYNFNGNNLSPTFGYMEEKGIAINWNIDDKENTYYVRTMEMMNDFVANSIHIRTFVTAEYNTDGETKTAIIYSENVRSISVAQIANYFYLNNMANNQNQHNYIYNNILHNTEVLSRKNPYYLKQPVEYGWNGGVVNP